MSATIKVAKAGDHWLELPLKMANRHGLIAGATGTGKTVTLQLLAEQFAAAGANVFMADVKGDLSGLAAVSAQQDFVGKRLDLLEIDNFVPQAAAVTFWDVFAENGIPLRASVSEIGPLLLARMLELNDTQEGALTVIFRCADDADLHLVDLKDLQAVLAMLAENPDQLPKKYGHIAPATLGTIQRRLLTLEEQGADLFFGAPAVALDDLLAPAPDGRGMVHVLAADRLIQSPRLYASLLLWLLSEFYENLPEVGDLPVPKLVFFFDEAHLLFQDAPKPLMEKIEQVVRLIRSKGVGIYFITQSPQDIPPRILEQLGHKIQHGLRAFSATGRAQIMAVAACFRENPALDLVTTLPELAVGEACVSLLDEKGIPQPVERALVPPPQSQIGAIDAETRQKRIHTNPLWRVYGTVVDEDSAYETLAARTESSRSTPEIAPARPRAVGRPRQTMLEVFAKSMLRSVGNQIAREVMRGVLGSLRR